MTDYQSLASQVNDAFKAYRDTYAATNPAPDLQKIARKHATSNKAMYRLLGVLVVASVIVSGSHTVPVFADSLPDATPVLIKLMVSVAAFVAIEVAILVYAYQRVEKAYDDNPDMSKDVQKLMGWGLKLAISVALGANVYSVLQPHMTGGVLKPIWEGVSIVVAVLVGISAPVLAFIAGELFGLMNVQARERKAFIINEYEAALETWEADLREVWGRDRAKWGARVSVERPSVVIPSIEAPSVLSVQTQTDRQVDKEHGSGVGFTRRSDAVERAFEHLRQNPDDMALTLRQLETVIGVGKDSINKAKQRIQQEQQS